MLDRGQFVFQFCLATEQRKWCFHDTTAVQPAEQPAALCTRSLTECADFAQCEKKHVGRDCRAAELQQEMAVVDSSLCSYNKLCRRRHWTALLASRSLVSMDVV